MSNEERLGRPHVVRRIAEISDASDDGNPCLLVTSTAAQRIASFEHYVQNVEDTPEPSAMDDEQLIETYDGFMADLNRYTMWNEEHNFAIMALAGEWVSDIKDEILRRMKARA